MRILKIQTILKNDENGKLHWFMQLLNETGEVLVESKVNISEAA